MLPTTTSSVVPASVRGLVLGAALLAATLTCVRRGEIDGVIAADQGTDGGAIPPDSYPGAEDGFVRGVDADGQEAYRYEYQNNVYVIPADQYYRWREDYYHDGYHGGLTQAMLIALLLRPTYHPVMYSHSYFYTSYHWGAPTTAYYSTAAYHSHFGTPAVVNGRVVHTSAATGRPVGGGTPVARARPVATARPVSAAGTPVAKGTPVATAKPAPAKPAPAKPATSRWATARTRTRTVRSFRCFSGASLVTLAEKTHDGAAGTGRAARTATIDSIRAGDVVAAWPSPAAVLAGEPPRPIRVASVQRSDGAHGQLRGLVLGGGERLPPFVTVNHPMLAVSGRWSAIDEGLASDELLHYAHNRSDVAAKPPLVSRLREGDSLLVAAVSSASEGGAPKVRRATVEAIVVEDAEKAPAARAAPVYSLELDTPGYAVYMVNGVLVMD